MTSRVAELERKKAALEASGATSQEPQGELPTEAELAREQLRVLERMVADREAQGGEVPREARTQIEKLRKKLGTK